MRRPDCIGLMLLTILAAALLGGGFAVISSGLIKPWELATILAIGGVLVAAASPRAPPTRPRNTMVHGTAQPAAKTEARAAARGVAKASNFGGRSFSD